MPYNPDNGITDSGGRFVTERRDIWAQLAVFTAVTYAVASIFMYLVIREGSIRAYGGLCAVGGMWSPFVGVLVTRLIFGGEYGRTLRGLGWRWGRTRYQVWSYVLPVLYVGAAHVLVWVTGQGGFVVPMLNKVMGFTGTAFTRGSASGTAVFGPACSSMPPTTCSFRSHSPA